MNFNIGDRVRFLSEKGGGVVVKIRNSNIVVVHTDDDFDIPYHVKDLVKIEPRGKAEEFFSSALDKKQAEKKPDVAETYPKNDNDDDFDDRHSKIIKYNRRNPIPEGVYLAWLPQNQNLLTTGFIDLYLLNDTRFDVLFSIFLQNENGSFSGTDYDAIPAHQKVLLTSFDRDKLEKWSRGVVQLLFHFEEEKNVMSPVSAEFKILPSRFYKEDNYLEYSFLEGKSFVCELAKTTTLQSLQRKDEKGMSFENKTLTTSAQQAKPESFIDKHLTSPHEAVVDLHIESLTDEYRRMTEYEIFDYQCKYFTQCLESAIINKIYKITFIHGVGNGILKRKISEILTGYENITVQDAPMRQFGIGALEVLLHKIKPQ